MMTAEEFYDKFKKIVDLPDNATKIVVTAEVGEPVKVEAEYYSKSFRSIRKWYRTFKTR